jgi:hypothetical protein
MMTAQEKWQAMLATRYPAEQVKQYIDKSLELSKTANVRTGEQILLIHQAQAMMTYNQMIDDRVASARESWKK